jgi:DeoR/GlpR family transcriptional regulator of sugar metabolism
VEVAGRNVARVAVVVNKKGRDASSRLVAFERRDRIADLVRDRGSIRASELTNLFGVTDETIRRDLARLAELGVLQRAHGGAVATTTRAEATFERRLHEHETEKIAIARAAAELVRDGSRIIIDSGTTTVQFAKALAPSEISSSSPTR